MSKSEKYEKLAQEIYQELIKLEGYQDVRVHHDSVLVGKSSAPHQIDVHWEIIIGCVKHITCIECKDWKARVKKEHIASFSEILKDIGAKGIYITKTGYQKSAKTLADYNNIRLVLVEDIEDKHGTILRIGSPVYRDLNIDFCENVDNIVSQLNLSYDTPIYDENRNVDCLFYDLLGVHYENGYNKIEYENKYLCFNNKMIGINFIEYMFDKGVCIELKSQNYFAKAIVKDFQDNKEFYFNMDNTISFKS